MSDGLNHAERHSRLFDRIALPYSWFFKGQLRTYAECFEIGRSAIPRPEGGRALDIGCGTGAFTAALRAEGWQVEGVDAARRMVARARRRGLPCGLGDFIKGLDYGDNSFDLVTAAYVAHGLLPADRLALYREARRLSRGLVLFHDYTSDRRLLTSLVERAEGGDYFNFIGKVEEELASAFSELRVIRVGRQSAWYLCRP